MQSRKHKHLTFEDRLTIERMMLRGFSKIDIAMAVDCSLSTLYYELKRGEYNHMNADYTYEKRYSPEIAQSKYEENKKRNGKKSKILSDDNLRRYIAAMIVNYKYSPKAIILKIKTDNLKFDFDIKSVNTIYAAISKGYIEGVTLELLPRRGRNKKRKKQVKVGRSEPAGTSIEQRSEEVLTRETFGNWEMDCVIGQQKNRKTLLVLTERKSRFEIIEVLKRHTAAEVIKALNRIEKRFGASFYKIFKTITVDNGSEFKNYRGMEKALYRKGNRTKVFYCHPYSSYERGSNENNNHLVRRFFHKGEDFDETVNRNKVKEVEEWINFYPRLMFNGNCAYDLFIDELRCINCNAII